MPTITPFTTTTFTITLTRLARIRCRPATSSANRHPPGATGGDTYDAPGAPEFCENTNPVDNFCDDPLTLPGGIGDGRPTLDQRVQHWWATRTTCRGPLEV